MSCHIPLVHALVFLHNTIGIVLAEPGKVHGHIRHNDNGKRLPQFIQKRGIGPVIHSGSRIKDQSSVHRVVCTLSIEHQIFMSVDLMIGNSIGLLSIVDHLHGNRLWLVSLYHHLVIEGSAAAGTDDQKQNQNKKQDLFQ